MKLLHHSIYNLGVWGRGWGGAHLYEGVSVNMPVPVKMVVIGFPLSFAAMVIVL